MIDVANKSYGVERVLVDGKHFSNCKFDGSELVFSGKLPFRFSKNEIYGLRMKFEGNAALTTDALIALYADEAFRPFIERTLENIKKEGLARNNQR